MNDLKREFEALLYEVVARKASDLHLSIGRKPQFRIDGSLVTFEEADIISEKKGNDLMSILMSENQKERFLENREIDFSYTVDGIGRFRVNVFFQRGNFSVALRLIPSSIQTLDELGHPDVLHDLLKTSQGFFIVVGPSGQGKSTTLASMIDEINHQRKNHIVTIEDPIEYLFEDIKSIIDQREVGNDTKGFNVALRSVLRQDPDVIMVGEMRDSETISAAITASETGHLVFSTLHTNNASQTIDRIIDSFPPAQQSQIKAQLAGTLLGVLSKRLIPRIDGGRVAAFELLIANSAVRNLIREGKTHQIDLVIETSADIGMVSLNKSLSYLVKSGIITMENAEMHSLNPVELRMLIK
ncbi:MAG: type IV pilus twitching motility protein PilT [Patescibacteria group bacterium]